MLVLELQQPRTIEMHAMLVYYRKLKIFCYALKTINPHQQPLRLLEQEQEQVHPLLLLLQQTTLAYPLKILFKLYYQKATPLLNILPCTNVLISAQMKMDPVETNAPVLSSMKLSKNYSTAKNKITFLLYQLSVTLFLVFSEQSLNFNSELVMNVSKILRPLQLKTISMLVKQR